jgi:hypothetical protein
LGLGDYSISLLTKSNQIQEKLYNARIERLPDVLPKILITIEAHFAGNITLGMKQLLKKIVNPSQLLRTIGQERKRKGKKEK